MSRVQEIITHNLALSLLHCLDTEISVSTYVGMVKGRTAIRVLQRFKELGRKPYWGNHFWTKGYCVDTIGLDMEKIQAYVRYQDWKDQQIEQRQLGLQVISRCGPSMGPTQAPALRVGIF